MLKEQVTITYACRVISALQQRQCSLRASDIAAAINTPYAYTCKVLSRLTHVGLIKSSTDGYTLQRPLQELSVYDILTICQVTDNDKIGLKLLELAKSIPLATVL